MRGVLILLFLAFSLTASASPRLFTDNGEVPWGAKVWCLEHPDDCSPVQPAQPINYLLWESRLADVDLSVNQSITYLLDDWDRWDLSPKYGDCDDYAVTKRDRLIKLGVPKGALQMAYVLHVSAGNHVVLLVNTDYGYKVLDNLSNEVYDLDRMMITRLSLQDARNPRVWKQIF